MPSVLILGVLSGMVFGAMGMIVRRFAGFVVLFPILATPLAYIYIWRDSISGPCLFADAFRTAACTPTREFVFTTMSLAEDALVVSTSHLVVGFSLVLFLTVFRSVINAIDFATPRTLAHRAQMAEAMEQWRAAQPAPVQTPPPSFVDGLRDTGGFALGESGSVVVPFSAGTVQSLARGETKVKKVVMANADQPETAAG